MTSYGIDDVTFHNCSLPTARKGGSGACPSDGYRCVGRDVCVEGEVVCDYNDDCGDRSDEGDSLCTEDKFPYRWVVMFVVIDWFL